MWVRTALAGRVGAPWVVVYLHRLVVTLVGQAVSDRRWSRQFAVGSVRTAFIRSSVVPVRLPGTTVREPFDERAVELRAGAAALDLPASLRVARRTQLGAREQADPHRDATAPLAANLVTLFVALYLQVSQGDRQVELALTLAESEMREAELVHEQEQM